jgi:cold shock CspA family protein
VYFYRQEAVEFDVEMSEKGPQAAAVRRIKEA